MRWIYISPHLDDAALCAGGLIFDQVRLGQQVEIWTVMAGLPEFEALSEFAQQMHARWSTGSALQTVERRRDEDREAAEILGAHVVHLDFPDAIYRRGPDGEPLYADPVGASLSPHDAALPPRIAAALRSGLRRGDRLISLLGIGGHVDHVLARRAAELLARPLRYLADFPYVIEHPGAVAANVVGLRSSVIPISEPALGAWISSVRLYRSQLATVFKGLDPAEAIRAYLQAHSGLQLWQAAPSKRLDSGRKS